MRSIIRPVVAVLTIACVTGALPAVSSGAFAQAQKDAGPKPVTPAPAAAPAEMPALKQMPLTEKQIESVLAAQKDLEAVTEKLPDSTTGKPDAKVVAQLDAVAKKYGFADYADYNLVTENISLVFAGFDAKTKAYVGPETVIKTQIAAITADTKIPEKEKKEALAELNEAVKTPPPPVENKGNIELVAKCYDKLLAAMQDDE